ncbi:MAG TPA: hypothetical protein DCM28_23160, partial [Phycisphaerales bacterium]|nr:hypothetical protein [Phycisphaerales bacterium]
MNQLSPTFPTACTRFTSGANAIALLVTVLVCLTQSLFAQESDDAPTLDTTPKPTSAEVSANLDWSGLGKIAVMQSGRLKPLDTVARSSMLMICGKQTVKVEGRPTHAMQWLMDVMCKPELADLYRVFLIHDPDIKALLKLGDEDKRWSFTELAPHLRLLAEQANQASDVQPHQRNRYQRAVLELYSHLNQYTMLKNAIAPEKSPDFGKELAQVQMFTEWLVNNTDKIDEDAIKQLNILKQHYEQLGSRSSIHFVPPIGDLPWQKIGEHMREVLAGLPMDPSVPLFAVIRQAYRQGDWQTVNQMIADHLQTPEQIKAEKVHSEAKFNRIALLVNAMPVYVLALVVTLLAMMLKKRWMLIAGVAITIIAVLMHSSGLGWRMWIEGRPPVINLYGSAVFIGWGATIMALILEKIYKNGLATIAACLIGFSTLIIAHHLSLSGDTIEPVRAVLNSNFWLGTHVIVVTLGYSAMFVAGAIAIIFVIRDVILRNLTTKTYASMGRMAYGIICFAMLFSFVGTVLGGIWADQSWGRFWGWD